MKSPLRTLIQPTLNNFCSSGSEYQLHFQSLQNVNSLVVSIKGNEIEKSGKKINSNIFFEVTKTWSNGEHIPTNSNNSCDQELPYLGLALPINLPTSYTNKKLGVEVYYELSVEAKINDAIDRFTDKLFLVSRAPEGVPLEHNRTASRAAIMGRSVLDSPPNSIPVNMEFSVDKTYYFFGDSITCNLYLDNDTEETVQSLKLSLIQLIIFDSSSKQNSKLVLKEIPFNRGFPVECNKTLKEVVQFELPSLNPEIPPTLRGSNVFRIEYSIQADLVFQNPKAVSPSARATVLLYSLPSGEEINTDIWKKSFEKSQSLSKNTSFASKLKSRFS